MISNWPFPDAFRDLEDRCTPDFISFGDDWSQVFALLSTRQPKVCVEIGSFTGNSSCALADQIRHWGGNLICVDTWLGSPGMWLDPIKNQWLNWHQGRPEIYSRFLNNVKSQNLQHTIIPLCQTSSGAAEILRSLAVKIDFVYWDGGHDDLGSDLEKFVPLLSPGALWVGDDLDQHAQIRPQINNWLRSNPDWTLTELGNYKWTLESKTSSV